MPRGRARAQGCLPLPEAETEPAPATPWRFVPPPFPRQAPVPKRPPLRVTGPPHLVLAFSTVDRGLRDCCTRDSSSRCRVRGTRVLLQEETRVCPARSAPHP